MHVATVVSVSYLPYARTLAESVRLLHQDAGVTVLVLDPDDDLAEDFAVLTPDDLRLSRADFHEMAAMYDVTELATAVKPWLLDRLLDDHAVVAFLDPDIALFAPLDELDGLAEAHGIVLTPHRTTPMPRDGKRPDERDLLLAGTYNLGFVAVSRAARPFLAWWQERLRHNCLRDPEHGLYVDQRWVELAVHCFDHHVVRDDTWNVAYWNLDARVPERDRDTYVVNGRPLRFFHFSGFKPGTPFHTDYFGGTSRVENLRSGALAELFRTYDDALRRHGADAVTDRPWRYAASATGVPLRPELRRWFRDDVLAGRTPPDPFDQTSGPAFADWARRTDAERQRERARELLRTLSLQARSAGRTARRQLRDLRGTRRR